MLGHTTITIPTSWKWSEFINLSPIHNIVFGRMIIRGYLFESGGFQMINLGIRQS